MERKVTPVSVKLLKILAVMIKYRLFRNVWLSVCFVSAASQYLSFLAHQCVSMSGLVCLPVTDGAPPPVAHSTSSGQWFPLMAPSGEDAGGNGQGKEEEEEGKEG